ncbi:MAG: CPBP family intramembrane metalloprotease [Chitinophagaceae bacterium]|nr:CPBP family intramembrane metalloprotease [Chitinophagaceae bacterium]
MKKIIPYFREYFRTVSKTQLLLTSLLCAILVFLNYHEGLEKKISEQPFLTRYISWVMIFSLAWIIPCAFIYLENKDLLKKDLTWLLLIAPLLFAVKMTVRPHFLVSNNPVWNNYWNHIIYWPFLFLVIGSSLFFIGKIFRHDQLFFGSRLKGLDWTPYLWMLAFMVPLVILAATQPDFQAMYPKLQNIEGIFDEKDFHWWHKLLFELSYGSDFITIEFFFRGFLVLALAKYAGPKAILPMACFYCTIHFGKPLGECISSYFGGMLLGIVVYNTRSIFGGLMVHLGIAWLMELAGHLAR